mmetsp:Transcript_3574/g.7191  ORF Transcript_3574/g.7191 Transcript_3574/m.7191 type:complete len:365 (-) Transcript_3574:158-1252(-)|eukprot:CAMPEP_0167788050 /NCGR_PEP_ID=MMETSP0111_2-20121227/9803_1 /TAXON_ID=91324 /ORGANISM="Lotharella globosa, Strain CCCM811" /LENGTH=364 /DNA_ID=CAMNT_0007679841 /DNA_START=119 /DNA_END=1213 /DNA_ORIENTATION=+
MSLNYSKWDNIVCSSDDDDDCHPNIDKKLWRRLMKEKRERKAQEEQALKAKLEKENEKDKKMLANLKASITEDTKAETTKKMKSIELAIKKRDRELLAIFRRKKYSPEEMCHVVDERTIVNSAQPMPKDLKDLGYEKYVKRYEKKLETYSKLETESLSQGFLIKNAELLHDHCSGYLLLKALDFEMKGETESMVKVVKQYLIVQYVLDLAKSMGGKDPREVLLPFFKKLEDSEKMAGLKEEVASFAEKIKARAKVKLEEQAKEREGKQTFIGEDGKEYEYVELTKEERMGPGGLDPIEVLQSLPKSLQEAFEKKDTEMLQTAIASLPIEEAKYHMDRCTKSGLWNPAGGAEEGEADSEPKKPSS